MRRARRCRTAERAGLTRQQLPAQVHSTVESEVLQYRCSTEKDWDGRRVDGFFFFAQFRANKLTARTSIRMRSVFGLYCVFFFRFAAFDIPVFHPYDALICDQLPVVWKRISWKSSFLLVEWSTARPLAHEKTWTTIRRCRCRCDSVWGFRAAQACKSVHKASSLLLVARVEWNARGEVLAKVLWRFGFVGKLAIERERCSVK